ncbi:MAG: hypothetical protein DRO15_04600 [Thermoprotei archaeon]|nr:MAG: hypothetical protein DRO15_04600 [Thermoprotei archaeon]
MLKVGTSLWIGNLGELSNYLSRVKASDFDYVEISFDYPLGIDDKDTVNKIIDMLSTMDMLHAVHAPWADIALASPINTVREASLKCVRSVINFASELGAEYVVVHISSSQKICSQHSGKNPCIEAAILSVRELESLAREYGIPVVIENVPDKCCGSLYQIGKILDNVSQIDVCLDLGHAAYIKLKEGDSFSDLADIAKEWFPIVNHRVLVLHVHGVVKKGYYVEDHVELSEVKINFKEILRTYRSSVRYVTLEVFKSYKSRSLDMLSLSNYVKDIKSWALALMV